MPIDPITALLAITVNLVGLLLIYSFMTCALVQLRWHRGGTIAALMAIVVAGLFWLFPQEMGPSFYFGNAIVTMSAVIILSRAARTVPRQLNDAVQLDGCSRLAVFRHAIFPYVKGDIGLIALLIIMAMVPPFWDWFSTPDRPDHFMVSWERLTSLRWPTVGILVSLVTTVPAIVTFLIARRSLEREFAVPGLN